MKIGFILICLFLFSSCNVLTEYKEKEAIKLVQETKFGVDNILRENIYLLLVMKDPTNLELANFLASKHDKHKFEWAAHDMSNNMFLVSFSSIEANRALAWEVDIKNSIVKYVHEDSELFKMYKNK